MGNARLFKINNMSDKNFKKIDELLRDATPHIFEEQDDNMQEAARKRIVEVARGIAQLDIQKRMYD